jgi:hypothetical protein
MDTGLDVLPDLFGLVPAQTQCATCDKIIYLHEAIITRFMVMEIEMGRDHFCSTACATHSDYFKADNE